MTPYRDAKRSSLLTCSVHGLRYDPHQHAGCLRCRSMAPGPLGPPLATHRALLVLAATLAVGAGAGVGLAQVKHAPADGTTVDHVAVPYHRTATRTPLVTRIDVDGLIRSARAVNLSCVAADVDGEPNQFRWLGPFGRTEESGSPFVRWTPAASGHASITCVVRNHVGTSMRTIDVDVAGGGPTSP